MPFEGAFSDLINNAYLTQQSTTMEVKHLGGLFIYTNQIEKMAEWYKQAFKLTYDYEQAGSLHLRSFYYNETDGDKRYLVFSLAKAESELPSGPKSFVLNLRVSSMDEALAYLKDAGIDHEKEQVHEQGRFAWLTDPDGNRVEIWEDTAI